MTGQQDNIGNADSTTDNTGLDSTPPNPNADKTLDELRADAERRFQEDPNSVKPTICPILPEQTED